MHALPLGKCNDKPQNQKIPINLQFSSFVSDDMTPLGIFDADILVFSFSFYFSNVVGFKVFEKDLCCRIQTLTLGHSL